MKKHNGITLGELIHDSVSKITSKTRNAVGDFVYNNGKGVSLALLGTLAVAAYHGITNPDLDMLNQDAPFYVVGYDQWRQWEFMKTIYSVSFPAVENYWSNLWINLAALPAGGLAQAGLRKVSQIRVH